MSRLFLLQNTIILGASEGDSETFSCPTSAIDNFAMAILNLRT